MTTIPHTMKAIVLTAHGGFDKLEARSDVPIPTVAPDEVLIKVLAAGVNNTDINTRIGWYSKSVKEDTANTGIADSEDDGGWAGVPFTFPRIQGGDCCGRIVAVGEQVDAARIGERVLVRTMMAVPNNDGDLICTVTGSERDGAFADYMSAQAKHALAVDCDWSDIELASIPCAYSTAEGMLHRAEVANEMVLITGASGGVGSAAIQLAKRRGATVVAIAGKAKAKQVAGVGADRVIARGDDLVEALGENSVDVVIDLVAGPSWPSLLNVLKSGGRYVASGAIAGPIVELDVRTLYLKDLTLMGSTHQSDEIFENLVSYIERGEIRPLIAQTFDLSDIVAAQQMFLEKNFIGKIVLVP